MALSDFVRERLHVMDDGLGFSQESFVYGGRESRRATNAAELGKAKKIKALSPSHCIKEASKP